MNQNRYGSLFALITFFLLIGLFFLHLQGYFDPAGKMHISADGRELRLPAHQGHYFAKGTINGIPVTFLIDTGASTIAVNQKIANEAKLKYGASISSSTANGRVSANSTIIASLTIGDLQVQNISAMILPDMDDEVLLGMNFLRHFNWRQENDELILSIK